MTKRHLDTHTVIHPASVQHATHGFHLYHVTNCETETTSLQ